MKIYNKVILSWNEDKQQFDTVYEDSYDYYGDVDYFAPSEEDIKSEMRRKNENVGHSKLSIESSLITVDAMLIIALASLTVYVDPAYVKNFFPSSKACSYLGIKLLSNVPSSII